MLVNCSVYLQTEDKGQIFFAKVKKSRIGLLVSLKLSVLLFFSVQADRNSQELLRSKEIFSVHLQVTANLKLMSPLD